MAESVSAGLLLIFVMLAFRNYAAGVNKTGPGLGAWLKSKFLNSAAPATAAQKSASLAGLAAGSSSSSSSSSVAAGGWSAPLAGVTECHPFTGAGAHEGVDLTHNGAYGAPILAARAGTVRSAGAAGGCGLAVMIDSGSGLTTRYCHASRILVHVGQHVTAGQKIAEVGQTGEATGPHLHFEVRQNGTPVNPCSYIACPKGCS